MQVCYNKALYAWLDSSDWLQFHEFRCDIQPADINVQRVLAGGLAGDPRGAASPGGGEVGAGVGVGELIMACLHGGISSYVFLSC